MSNRAAAIGQFGEEVGTKYSYPVLFSEMVDGSTAGDLAVTEILLGDVLVTVIDVSGAGVNLVDEFTVTADATINNAAGTNTTGMTLLVQWYRPPTGL